MDTHQRREALYWSDQYRLDHLQHPREHGGGRTWTWSLTENRFGLLAASMDRYAAGHGRQCERTDDLDALVEAKDAAGQLRPAEEVLLDLADTFAVMSDGAG